MISIDRLKLKNSNKMKVTRGLFLETSDSPNNILYTLKQEDHLGYPSLYKLFLESCLEDPSEYTFAVTYFWDWEHWLSVSNSTWCKDFVAVWREEVQAALESKYLSSLHLLVSKGGKEAFPALRYLLERLEKATGAIKRGRPRKGTTRAEIERTASAEALEAKQVQKDLDRISTKGLN